MYETEINRLVQPITELPEQIQEAFRISASKITGRSVLPWGEHCTECVWPSCYETCDLYDPRLDGKCRRFVDGMVRIDHPQSATGYVLKLRFKRWAKLWTVGNTRIFSLHEANAIEDRDLHVARRMTWIPLSSLRVHYIKKRYNTKKRLAQQSETPKVEEPDYFLVECYNPTTASVSASLVMRSLLPDRLIAFQHLMILKPGFNREEIPFKQIKAVLNVAEPFGIDISPNETQDILTLYFGCMDFVTDSAFSRQSAPCKALVWDLDNTLWNGILIEDGPEKITLKPEVREIITELDRRGILLSVVSKNNPEESLALLRKFELEEFFLYPQISWLPKSDGLRRIAEALNIGLDSIALIDDSAFERAQVLSACPGIRVIDALEYLSLTRRPEFQVNVSAESGSRRQSYRQQQLREASMKTFTGEYLDFLRECHLQLSIGSLSATNLVRVHELTQRTNQMNFSGNRYTRQQLETMLGSRQWDTYVLECSDSFGKYGTIGFSVVDHRENRMIDLMFSCRVQSKRVEHAFLTYLLRKYTSEGADFYVNYRRTSRNAPSGKVFDDFGFQSVEERDGTSVLIFRASREIPDDGIFDIAALERGAG